MFNFEKLDVWQEAIQFADLVYELTGNFPDEERFGLTNQMRRAAVSISSNIAGRKFTRVAHRFRSVCRNRNGISVRDCFAKHHRASAKNHCAERLQSDL